MSQVCIFILGNWIGKGRVVSSNTLYTEELQFQKIKDGAATVVKYNQNTFHEPTGSPMHFESGFLKFKENQVEASFSHVFGVNEIEYGKIEGNQIILVANQESQFQRAKSAQGKTTSAIRREYSLNPDGTLSYKMYLAVDGADLKLHLESELIKQ